MDSARVTGHFVFFARVPLGRFRVDVQKKYSERFSLTALTLYPIGLYIGNKRR